MNVPNPLPFQHSHRFNQGNPLAERNTIIAVAITAAMMVVEIIGGYVFHSMALLADGWHMSSHALALGISAGAYAVARRLANDRRFTFGTWKIEVLGGYSSALLLGVIAVMMLAQSIEHLIHPVPISYNQALPIAVVGLLVNLLCAWLLKDAHHHGHTHDHDDHSHGHDAHHRHEDINLKSAYLHVVADAATSVLAILALLGGKVYGIAWLDPVMGILGALLVAQWAISLIRTSGRILLDGEMDHPVVDEIRDVIAETCPHAAISDLHVWRVGGDRFACILALVCDRPLAAEAVRGYLSVHEELVHVTVEISHSQGDAMIATAS
ncbi:MAG: Cadmium, cobalt and zinc/H(+)-K(+) antiporter [Luteibacter sp.]|uniref:CDF family Co(II)/Ni(II) efflux transporter DmeF n=1 Tax=Luteibacter sp. TaxID=1886636 RepID=UPI00137E422B|nr:CDF family Co(II)/Ni(II) efflux transporter DmeF [Luteibacter sp.]KAF1007291.1 MAG: Cadmium, cobalt and zinc/H(+)-K(+) antiporter [Luteibacter sp.]